MAKKFAENLRRKFLINPRFQLFFMGFIGALSVISIGSIYLANLYFFAKFRNYGTSMSLPPEHVFFSFLKQEEADMKRIFLATALEMFVLITIFGLIVSHRIAGPIYRLTQHLRETARTRIYKPIYFRKGDLFQEISEAYNSQVPENSQDHSRKE